MAPSAEVFPGGSWERAWTAGEDGEELVVPYEAGAPTRRSRARESWRSSSTASRRLDPVAIDGAGLYDLAPTPATRATASDSAPPRACGSGR